ncbi:MAG: aldo/keto reductase [Armatimonadetes bacterium]|nr:aldo/keto reductase [Armatimonadota bacterium]MDW8121831.1 aldo/keto reductase [Armatimonadota bacterium]
MIRGSRREFLKNLSALSLSGLAQQPSKADPMPKRILGRTGVAVPVLGLGFGTVGTGLNEAQALSLMEAALDLGVTYWDTAPTYSRAQEYMGKIVPKVRDRIFLVTKTATQDGDRALQILENSLRTLKTDWVDLVHIHNIGDYDPDRVLGKGGVLEGLRKAQKRGWLRFIGLSGHLRPSRFAQVLKSGEFDVIMPAVNFADRFTYDFESKVLPIARKEKAGIVAMKVMAGPRRGYGSPNPARLADYASSAIRYALTLPGVACAVVGMFTIDELEQNTQVARHFQPLSPEEHQRLATIGRQLALRWGSHYGDPT